MSHPVDGVGSTPGKGRREMTEAIEVTAFRV